MAVGLPELRYDRLQSLIDVPDLLQYLLLLRESLVKLAVEILLQSPHHILKKNESILQNDDTYFVI